MKRTTRMCTKTFNFSLAEYKELVSCSNCLDYQSRELEIRYGMKKQTAVRKDYVHLLNSTLTATGRTLCCILENYQTPDGFVVVSLFSPLRNGSC
jgi:seryl-tRNA synthetase